MRKPDFNTGYYKQNPDISAPEFKLFPQYKQWFLNKILPTKSDKQERFLARVIWKSLSSISKQKYKNQIPHVLSVADEMNTQDWFEYCTYEGMGRAGKPVIKIYKGDALIEQFEKYIMDNYM